MTSSSAGVRARAEQLAEDLRDRGADGELLLSLSEAADHIVCFALAERADALREGLMAKSAELRERGKLLRKEGDYLDGCNGRPSNPERRRELWIRGEALIDCADELAALSSAPAPSGGPSSATPPSAEARRPCQMYLDVWKVGTDWLKVPEGAVCPRCGFLKAEHPAEPSSATSPAPE